jgi:hypothetical protein
MSTSAHPRKPYPPHRKRKGRPFDAAMWRRWLAERWPNPTTTRLRAGIQELRQRLEVRP